MKIIYLDRLSFFSLPLLVFSRVRKSQSFYFHISTTADVLTTLFATLRLLKNKPQRVEFCLSDIRDRKGESQFIRIYENIKDICLEISGRELAVNDFLKELGQHFDFRKILLFFEKIIADRMKDSVIFINAARWHADKIGYSGKNIIFFKEKDYWSKYLLSYADKFNVRIKEYSPIVTSLNLAYITIAKNFIAAKLKFILKLSAQSQAGTFISSSTKTSFFVSSKTPLLAAWYTGRTVTFDLNKRSDFFWLMRSGIPYEQVLIYFDRKDIPATEDTSDILKKEGIKKCLALSRSAATSKNIPIWNPTTEYKKVRNSFIRLILQSYLLNTVKFNITPLFFIINMLYFVEKYAYWYDFFNSNNIKINISPNDFTKMYIPKNLALERSGGVSISYQWSNLSFSSIGLSGCSNTMFSFGPEYKRIWRDNRSAIDSLLYCGYITDYSFNEVKEDSHKLREELFDKGVNFVVCFFDENSHDDRMSVITNSKAAAVYKFLIEKVLKDETLGLIFKPGYPKTLYQRLSSITDLIDKAKTSGRCIFMDKGGYVTERYPTEAAQAADLCVGLLLSGTVALESYLSGTPTVFLDLEKLYSNPIYQWGKGKAVFDNLDDLFIAINRYRENLKSIPGFGDLSSWAKDKDPFKDGNASLRIGQYVGWLLEMFNQGKTREEAMEYANQRYAELWGKESVVRINPKIDGIN